MPTLTAVDTVVEAIEDVFLAGDTYDGRESLTHGEVLNTLMGSAAISALGATERAFWKVLKNLSLSQIGYMFVMYCHESSHMAWDGFNPGELRTIRVLLDDIRRNAVSGIALDVESGLDYGTDGTWDKDGNPVSAT